MSYTPPEGATFAAWTAGRALNTLGTNHGAAALPFQRWRRFKEAFAPELIERAVANSERPVSRCLDPFGGSGTTALACQFLGVHPTTIEVNPYLADLIESKLCRYDADSLASDLRIVLRRSRQRRSNDLSRFVGLPPTFMEPGVGGRWIYDRSVATRIATLITAIDSLSLPSHRRLFRVLLGGVLVEISNVTISGKGRRYRREWRKRRRDPEAVELLFAAAVRAAIADVHRFGERACRTYDVVKGDSRCITRRGRYDLAVFSPPYPNSFDYTDVYNIELWILGYFRSRDANSALRRATLCSHVQLFRQFPLAPRGSASLDKALSRLRRLRPRLWSPWIPEMVGGYFADLLKVLKNVQVALRPGATAWMVVGDSRYSGVSIPTARILGELAALHDWRLARTEPFRSMRVSPQQGGHAALAESLVVLAR